MIMCGGRNTLLYLLLTVNVVYINYVLYTFNYSKTPRNSNITKNNLHHPVVVPILNKSDPVESRIKARLARVRQNCLREHSSTPLNFSKLKSNQWPWIYVSQKHKLLYCQTPKVGTTNWLKLFQKMENKINNTGDIKKKSNVHAAPLLLYSYLNATAREHALKHYKKFMVIREPFQRALSAFKDKFLMKPGFYAPAFMKLAMNIIAKYRNMQSTKSDRSKHGKKELTFAEFVQYVVDLNDSDIIPHYSEPRHWQPQVDLCYPCNIDYDYILEMEHIEEEANFVLRANGVPSDVVYPKASSDHVTNTNFSDSYSQRYNQLMHQYYSKVDPKLVNALYHYYKQDYDIFSYSPPPQF